VILAHCPTLEPASTCTALAHQDVAGNDRLRRHIFHAKTTPVRSRPYGMRPLLFLCAIGVLFLKPFAVLWPVRSSLRRTTRLYLKQHSFLFIASTSALVQQRSVRSCRCFHVQLANVTGPTPRSCFRSSGTQLQGQLWAFLRLAGLADFSSACCSSRAGHFGLIAFFSAP